MSDLKNILRDLPSGQYMIPAEVEDRRIDRAARSERFMFESYIDRRLAELDVQTNCLNARVRVLHECKNMK